MTGEVGRQRCLLLLLLLWQQKGVSAEKAKCVNYMGQTEAIEMTQIPTASVSGCTCPCSAATLAPEGAEAVLVV